jgi:hypothetical protein
MGFYAFTLAAVIAVVTLATVPAHVPGVDDVRSDTRGKQ